MCSNETPKLTDGCVPAPDAKQFLGQHFVQWEYLAQRIRQGMRCSVEEATRAATQYMIDYGTKQTPA